MRVLAIAGMLTGTAVLAQPGQAGAAVWVSSSGTTVTVAAAGDGSVEFSCIGGSFAAGNVKASPLIACGAVKKVVVTGDGSAQTVHGDQLGNAVFSGDPNLEASLGDGNDWMTESPGADVIDMGPGNDTLFIATGGSTNGVITMGTGVSDTAYFDGTDGPDFITATSTNADVTGSVVTNDGGSNKTVKNVDFVNLRG
ncbi:MAG: hypothetical protein ACTHN0_03015, partial [Aquihabitans sp.]